MSRRWGLALWPTLASPPRARTADAAPPQWVGELYLELHRGTYTSQAFVKAGNRHMEARLRETEALALLALLHTGGYRSAGVSAGALSGTAWLR